MQVNKVSKSKVFRTQWQVERKMMEPANQVKHAKAAHSHYGQHSSTTLCVCMCIASANHITAIHAHSPMFPRTCLYETEHSI